MSNDADELQARIDKLSSDPNANVGLGSEIERLKRQLPYANTQPLDKRAELHSQEKGEG